jgi:formate dehydrogenase major subunit
MATRDTGQPSSGISRRDFLKATAATTAVAACGLDFAFDAEKAAAYEGNSSYTVTFTTCPYCSASCGQRVVKENSTGNVVDVYGDFESPMNSGGLCSKGAGALQLVNNSRRIGAWPGAHPEDNIFAYDSAYDATGVAYRREGDGAWSKVTLGAAFSEISTGLMAARATDTAGWDPANRKYNSKGVAFFGSSHMNNESNYIYRKLIANFGTSNVEHQARI